MLKYIEIMNFFEDLYLDLIVILTNPQNIFNRYVFLKPTRWSPLNQNFSIKSKIYIFSK